MSSKKTPTKDITMNVMGKIQAGEVHMKPKIFFAVGALVMGVGMGLLLTFSVVTLSFISFHFRYMGSFDFLRFGPPGLKPFMATFPFFSLVVFVLMIMGGLWLIRRYDFSYQHNWWAVVLGVVALIISSGLMIDRLGAHQRLMRQDRFKPLYRQESRGDTWLSGEILTQSESMWKIVTLGETEILLDVSQAHLPRRRQLLPGDLMRAVGEWQGEQFHAEAVFGGGNPMHMSPTRPLPGNQFPGQSRGYWQGIMER